jgi:hypothetical protein
MTDKSARPLDGFGMCGREVTGVQLDSLPGIGEARARGAIRARRLARVRGDPESGIVLDEPARTRAGASASRQRRSAG